MKKSFLLSLLFLSFYSTIFCQNLEVADATLAPYTIDNMVQKFVGSGIQVIDYSFEGESGAVGFFEKGESSLGIKEGIILTTGKVQTDGGTFGADGNGGNFASNDNGGDVQDMDLAVIANGSLNDATVLEITFIPWGDKVEFRYVFASEEYPEWSCSQFNDVFGFFISGPGINGPFSNGGENIALIPNTDLPVSINNIHPEDGPICQAQFDQYYNDNNGTQLQPVYDGFLDVFTASIDVVPCNEYTLKLAISDVGDHIFDSAVFLEAESFGLAGNEIVSSLDEGQVPVLVEGCVNEPLSFDFSNFSSSQFPIQYAIYEDGSTASMGDDFEWFNSLDIIEEDNPVLELMFKTFQDTLNEGTENILLTFETLCGTLDTVEILIIDELNYQVSNDTMICSSSSLFIEVIADSSSFSSTFSTTEELEISETLVSYLSPIHIENLPFRDIKNELMIESVCVNIEHRWLDDLHLFLMAPNGQFLKLSTDNFSNCDDYTNTCFTPTATESIEFFAGETCSPGEEAPSTGNFQPEGSWTSLIGAPVNGMWNLVVFDDSQGFSGTLTEWSITFSDAFLFDYEYEWSTGDSTEDISVVPLENSIYSVTIQNGLSSCVDSVLVDISGQGVLSNFDLTFCSADSIEVEINGTIYNQSNPSGIEIFQGVLSNGCDSTVMVDLKFINPDTTELNEIIFEGESYQVGDELFTVSGSYSVPLLNQYGCDSLVYLNLIVSQFTFELPEFDTIISTACDTGAYCLPLSFSETVDYNVYVNNILYNPPFEPCDLDTTVCYSALSLVSPGDYTLHEWLINGTNISFTFEDLDHLVDSMQFYDPGINWQIPPIGNLLICAENTSNSYSNLVITNFEGDTIVLGVNFQIFPNSIGLILPNGANEVVLEEIISGYTDTTLVLINAPSNTANSILEIEVGEEIIFNLNNPIGCGNEITNIDNICPDLSGISAEVTISNSDFSVFYSGLSMGVDTACLEICTDLGNCDTLYVEIIVSDTMVATNEIPLEETIKIFPNPTQNVVNVELGKNYQNGNYALLDSNGKLIFRRNYREPNFKFETKELPDGIYFIEIQTVESVFYRKVMVFK